ncbi:MAG: hypothetical protein ACTSPO_16005 [Candidatus Heimdallarchaeaceae archaeon]
MTEEEFIPFSKDGEYFEQSLRRHLVDISSKVKEQIALLDQLIDLLLGGD